MLITVIKLQVASVTLNSSRHSLVAAFSKFWFFLPFGFSVKARSVLPFGIYKQSVDIIVT